MTLLHNGIWGRLSLVSLNITFENAVLNWNLWIGCSPHCIISSGLRYLSLASTDIYWCSDKAVSTWGKVPRRVFVLTNNSYIPVFLCFGSFSCQEIEVPSGCCTCPHLCRVCMSHEDGRFQQQCSPCHLNQEVSRCYLAVLFQAPAKKLWKY